MGSDKRCYLERMFTADDLATMQRLRAAFDPAGLANPSKLFATPAGCAESAKHKAVLLGGEGGGVLKHRAANRALARILSRRGGCAGAAGDSCRRQQRRRRGGEGRERG